MDPNTHSIYPPTAWSYGAPDGLPDGPLDDGLARLMAAVDELAAQDRDDLSDAVRAGRVLELRRLVDRLEGHWLKELAAVDARGAAGADQGQEVRATAAWLRNRLRMGAGVAHGVVRTARALFRGPLPQTGAALVAGELSPAHAKAVADGTHQLPPAVASAAEPVLLETARRVDPPRLRQAVGYLCQVADPTAPTARLTGATSAAGCGCRRPGRGWWPSMGGWNLRPGTRCWPPWNPWPTPPTPGTAAMGASGPPMP